MPNLSWTWTTLIDALQKWPRESSVAFVAQLPIIVGLAERRLWRDLNIEEYDKRNALLAMTTGTREVPKPSDVIQLRTIGYVIPTEDEDEEFRFLEKRSYEFCQLYSPRESIQGTPLYYTELEAGQILVVPTPDQDYAMRYRYVGPPSETLSSATPNTATWLSRSAADALFAACLMESEHYLKADDRYADMKDKYFSELLPVTRLELRDSVRAGDYHPLSSAAQTV